MSPGPASRGMTWKSVAVHSFDINDMNDMENMLLRIHVTICNMSDIQTLLLCMYVVACTPHQPSHHPVAALVHAISPATMNAWQLNQGTS